jgi:hypothetical protein
LGFQCLLVVFSVLVPWGWALVSGSNVRRFHLLCLVGQYVRVGVILDKIRRGVCKMSYLIMMVGYMASLHGG